MAFLPVSIVFSMRGLVQENRVIFPETTQAMACYLSCEDALQTDERGLGRREIREIEKQKGRVPDFPKRPHQLRLKEVVGPDGARLAEAAWEVDDAGLLQGGDPRRPDVRFARVTFYGHVLNALDTQEARALCGAFIAQETIRLNVLIDGTIEAPLLLKPQICYGGRQK